MGSWGGDGGGREGGRTGGCGGDGEGGEGDGGEGLGGLGLGGDGEGGGGLGGLRWVDEFCEIIFIPGDGLGGLQRRVDVLCGVSGNLRL